MTGSLPLSVLDLVPITAGSTPREALDNTLDLARHAEAFGYHRYWIAEHHMAPGVAGSAPGIVIALVAGATQHIRVGSGAVQMGHQTPLSVVEQFGLLDAAHPGRIDLGLGRSGRPRDKSWTTPRPPAGPAAPGDGPRTTRRGLLIPGRFDPSPLLKSPRFRAQARLLQQPGAETPDYVEQVGEVLALLKGDLVTADGVDVHAVPGEGAQVEVWILGSSAGASARVAGERGLRFAANYHVSPATVLESIAAYRAAFRPSAVLDRPHVLVSADVVVAPDDHTARRLASPYALWVRSIRTGHGAIRFAHPDAAAAHRWTDDDLALVADRTETQFVGSPGTVARRLEILAAETGADELLVTTITHDHADRVRSYQLLAQEWTTRSTQAPQATRARLTPAAATPARPTSPARLATPAATGGTSAVEAAGVQATPTPPGVRTPGARTGAATATTRATPTAGDRQTAAAWPPSAERAGSTPPHGAARQPTAAMPAQGARPGRADEPTMPPGPASGALRRSTAATAVSSPADRPGTSGGPRP